MKYLACPNELVTSLLSFLMGPSGTRGYKMSPKWPFSPSLEYFAHFLLKHRETLRIVRQLVLSSLIRLERIQMFANDHHNVCKLWSSTPLCHPEAIESDGTWRQIVFIYISKTTMSSVIACLQKATMSSSTFQKRQCLQSLHAFKRQQCLHLHFEDDSVFNHCMPSKGDNVFICILKTTMSSVIACLQKATMSSPQKLQCLLSQCFIGLDVLCFYAF